MLGQITDFLEILFSFTKEYPLQSTLLLWGALLFLAWRILRELPSILSAHPFFPFPPHVRKSTRRKDAGAARNLVRKIQKTLKPPATQITWESIKPAREELENFRGTLKKYPKADGPYSNFRSATVELMNSLANPETKRKNPSQHLEHWRERVVLNFLKVYDEIDPSNDFLHRETIASLRISTESDEALSLVYNPIIRKPPHRPHTQ